MTRIFPARIIFFETSGARIIWNFEMREFNRGRELFLNFFWDVARIIRNPVMRELIETICANYLKLRARIIWIWQHVQDLIQVFIFSRDKNTFSSAFVRNF